MNEDLDLLIKDFYTKYEPSKNTPEQIQAVKDFYGDNVDGLIKDFYTKYEPQKYSEEQVAKVKSFYSAQVDPVAVDEKKNPDQTQQVPQQEDTVSVSEDGSSELSTQDNGEKLYDFAGKKVSAKYLESMGVPVPQTEEELTRPEGEGKLEANEYTKALGSGITTLASGVMGLPSYIAEGNFAVNNAVARLTLKGKELEEFEKFDRELQALPEEQRSEMIAELQGSKSPLNRMFGIDTSPFLKASSKIQREMKNSQEEVNKTREEYETNIIDDLLDLDIGQASKRITTGILESLPIMAMTIFGGGAGLALMGASTASDKMEDLQRDGKNVDMTSLGVSALRGGAEALGGKVLQGIFKPAMGKVGEETARQLSKNVFKRIASAFGKEFVEEGSQSLQEELTDIIAYGDIEKTDWVQLFKNFVDAGIIGGFAASPAGLVRPKTKQPQQQLEGNDPFNGEVQELNIPAIEGAEELSAKNSKGKSIEEMVTSQQSLTEPVSEEAPASEESTPTTEETLPATESQLPAEQETSPTSEKSKEEDASDFEKAMNDSRRVSEQASNEPKRTRLNRLRATFTTRRPEIEEFFNKIGLKKSRESMDAVAGAKSATAMAVEDNSAIVQGLDNTTPVMETTDSQGNTRNLTERDLFDNVVKARAILGIRLRYEANPEKYKHLKDVKNMAGLTAESAKAYLEKLRETNEAVFEKVMDASWKYESRFQTLLDESLQEGLISRTLFNDLKDTFYSPRKVLDYLIENSENEQTAFMREDELGRQVRQSLQNFKKKIEKGTTKLDEIDAMYLLNLYTAGQTSRVFKNKSHRTFANELRAVESNYDNLSRRAKKAFDNFRGNVIFDTYEKFTSGNKPDYKIKKTPIGYTAVYYYENGQQQRYFMKDGLYEQFTDSMAKPQVANWVKWVTGSSLIKYFATGANIAFMYANIPMEFVHAVNHSPVYSDFILKGGGQLTKDYLKGMKSSYTQDEVYRNFIKNGGGQLFKTLEARRIIAKKNALKTLQATVSEKAKNNILSKVVSKIFDLQKSTEEGIRIAIFQRRVNQLVDAHLKQNNLPVKKGQSALSKQVMDDIYRDAVARSREVADFNRGSTFMKQVEGFIPYANITAQATDAVIKAYKDRPLSTALRHTQTATLTTAIFGAVGYFLVMMNMDDDEEKSVEDVMVETYNQQSRYTQDKYWIIPLGIKSENGNWLSMPIRKVESISFLTNLVEELSLRALAARSNTEYIERDLVEIAVQSGMENFAPIPVKPYISKEPVENNISKLAASVPLVSAAFAAQGIDAYTGKQLDYSGDEIYLEGRNSERIEPFIKTLSDVTTGSPARLQKIIQSYITTPNTNPIVGVAYESLNMFSKYKKEDSSGFEIIQAFGKGLKRRVVKEGFEYNAITKVDKGISREDINAEKAHYDFVNEVEGKYTQYLEDPTITIEKLESEIAKSAKNYKEVVPVIDDEMLDKYVAKVIKKMDNKETYEPIVWKIMFAPSDRIRAKKLIEYFGDNLSGDNFNKFYDLEENKKLWKEMNDSGAINEDVLKMYDRFVNGEEGYKLNSQAKRKD